MRDGAIDCITALLVLVLLAIAIHVVQQRDSLKTQAVERGFAEWGSDYNGNTIFVWKEPTKE